MLCTRYVAGTEMAGIFVNELFPFQCYFSYISKHICLLHKAYRLTTENQLVTLSFGSKCVIRQNRHNNTMFALSKKHTGSVNKFIPFSTFLGVMLTPLPRRAASAENPCRKPSPRHHGSSSVAIIEAATKRCISPSNLKNI